MKIWLVVMLAIPLSACAESGTRPAPAANRPAERPASAAVAARPAIDKRGLEAVIGKDAGTLTRMFGQPRLDVIEAYGRKLQFSGKACVLDAYLYPEKGGNEVVTYIDARRSDGAEVDRVACVNALQQR